MYNTGFDRFMFGLLAVLGTLLVVGAAAGLLVGAYHLWIAGKLAFLAVGAALYGIVRWITVPMYRKIERDF